MKTLVTGAAGQLGAEIVRLFGERGEVVALTRRELDLTDGRAVREIVVRARPDVVINCAAYNHVDRAEEEPEAALAVNAIAVRSLARGAEEAGAALVHYSTDFVFDGTASRPYTEEDPAYTSRFTPASRAATRTFSVAVTLAWFEAIGSFTDRGTEGMAA